MEYRIVYTSSPALRNRIAWRFWFQRSAIPYLYWAALPLVALFFAITIGKMSFSGEDGVVLGGLLGAGLILLVLLCCSYFVRKKWLKEISQKWDGRELVYLFDEGGISTEWENNFLRYSWSLVEKLECSNDFLLFFLDSYSQVVLPTALLTSELQQFILHKVREAGGKVVQATKSK